MTEVSFFFGWQNPTASQISLTADAYLVLVGRTEAISKDGYLPNRVSSASVFVDADLVVWGEWSTPQPTWVGNAVTRVVSSGAQGEGNLLYQHSAAVTTNVFRGVDLQSGFVAVPGNGEVLLQLSMQIQWDIVNTGSIDVDFSTGDFKIMTPGILLTQWGGGPNLPA